jgi:hypothetical protein
MYIRMMARFSCTANSICLITLYQLVTPAIRDRVVASISESSKLPMQSFRASPWVSYEPSLLSQQERDHPSGSDMDEDVDMDAPRISTLGDEDSSPHPNKKFPKKRPHKTTLVGGAGKVADEFDDEEDQLIDELIDDDDTPRLSPSARSTDAAQKRKASVKRKSRKGEKKAGEKKATAPAVVPTISIFKANPTNALEDIEMSASSAPIALAESSAPKAKKKVSPRKPTAVSRAMGKLAK